MDDEKRYTGTVDPDTEYTQYNEPDAADEVSEGFSETESVVVEPETSVPETEAPAADGFTADGPAADGFAAGGPAADNTVIEGSAADEAASDESGAQEPSDSAFTQDASSEQAGSAQDRPHDFDVDEPKFDTQTGERLDRPKKKYPGVILTLAVTAMAIGAFVYAVMPGKLPSLANMEEDEVETEVQLAIVPAAVQSETESEAGTEAAVQTEAQTVIVAQTETEVMTETETELETETETESETEAKLTTVAGPKTGQDKKDAEPEFKSEGVMLSATLDVSDMVEEVMPGIVSITCTNIRTVQDFFYGRQQIEQKDAGSGIIVDEDDSAYYIVTDAWVVEGAQELTVGFSVSREATEGLSDEDTLAAASVTGFDEETGLAMLKVEKDAVHETVRSLVKPSVLGDSDSIRVGERAIAIGNAMGYGLSVTEGIVSALDRRMTSDSGVHSYIQTDASINYGNYGGALLNRDGEVIGINSGKISRDSGEGMGYAFPINEAREAISRMLPDGSAAVTEAQEAGETEKAQEETSGKVTLQVAKPETEESASEEAAPQTEESKAAEETAPQTEESTAAQEPAEEAPQTEEARETEAASKGKGGMLGVSVAEVSDEYSIIYRIPKGVYVVGVVDDGGADKAGIREDDLIIAVNGEETPSVTALKEILSTTGAGDEAQVTYIRADENGDYNEDAAVTVTVVLQ